MNESAFKYTGYTLIDVTNTGVTTYSAETQRQRNQQRNWETIYQVLSLRSQLFEFKYLGYLDEDVSKFSFGINYAGVHRIWKFQFVVENNEAYHHDIDRYSGLKEDFSIAPIILGLDETAQPAMPLFFVNGPFKNIYFSADFNK